MSRIIPFVLLLPACGGGIKTAPLGVGIGKSCVDTSCMNGLVCANDGVCAEPGDPGTTLRGEDCSATQECEYGTVCAADNLCANPGAAGTGAAGDECGTDGDCQAGHFCGDEGACEDVGIPWWEGADCPAGDRESFYPYFNVPGSADQGDFYSLPYPNDIRLDTSGRPEFVDFPDPGALAPAVLEVMDALEAGITGFGLNPTVYFRFSQSHDASTIRVLGDDATVRWASIDPEVSDYGELAALQFFTREARGRYICQDWLAVSVYDGAPLLPGRTYAVWITKDVTNRDGVAAVRDNGFKVMAGDDRPDDLSLARAWDAYQPFRDYVEREDIDLDDIAVAAVFTTGQPSQGIRYFREVTGGEEVALASSDLTLCPATSPCDDGGARACGSGADGFDEVHGRLSVPTYKTAAGLVEYDTSSLRPTIQGMEDVCFALTLPPGTMPDAGWPVALYGPDVGGTFRDAAADGVAAYLAARGYATLSLELPAHGARGSTWADTAHPTLWRANQLQAVADAHALERYAREWSIDDGQSPTGDAIAFDPGNIWYVGLGEGGNVGVDYLAWSIEARGGVLGNPSGYQLHAMAEQTDPLDLSHGLQAAFADSSLNRWHPMLNMLQQYFELVDPVNAAPAVVRDSTTEAKHLMVVHGIEDAELPTLSLQSVLRALDVPTAGSLVQDYGQAESIYPVHENLSTDDGRRTAASVQVELGHDALLDAEVMGQVADFLDSGTTGSPTISN